MSIMHWPANRRKLHRGLPKSNSRALAGFRVPPLQEAEVEVVAKYQPKLAGFPSLSGWPAGNIGASRLGWAK